MFGWISMHGISVAKPNRDSTNDEKGNEKKSKDFNIWDLYNAMFYFGVQFPNDNEHNW